MKNDIIAFLLTVETFRLPIWTFQNKIQMAVVIVCTCLIYCITVEAVDRWLLHIRIKRKIEKGKSARLAKAEKNKKEAAVKNKEEGAA